MSESTTSALPGKGNPPPCRIGHSRYGDTAICRDFTHAQLLAIAKQTGCVLARAEYSGCEGCYIETARWSNDRRRWERFTFEKVFGGEHPSESEDAHVSCLATAIKFVDEINAAADTAHVGFIHNLPNWEGGE